MTWFHVWLACSLILSRMNYYEKKKAVLHGAPTGTIQQLQRVQNNAARIVLQTSRRSHAKPPLAVSPAADHIQAGSSDVQSSEHVHSGLSARPNHGMCLQPNVTFICHPAAGPTVHQDTFFQACFPIFSTACLELAAKASSDQRF